MRSYTPGAYTHVVLVPDTTQPAGFDVISTLDGRQVDVAGAGYLAGTFPDGITSVEGVPGPAHIRVLYRAAPGMPGGGALVAETTSSPDGTWLVEGLNPDLKYDVICRHEGYNDMILSNVSPVLATGPFPNRGP